MHALVPFPGTFKYHFRVKVTSDCTFAQLYRTNQTHHSRDFTDESDNGADAFFVRSRDRLTVLNIDDDEDGRWQVRTYDGRLGRGSIFRLLTQSSPRR
jgi:hypothetical protein